MGRITWIGNRSGEITNGIEATSFVRNEPSSEVETFSKSTHTGYIVQDGELTNLNSEIEKSEVSTQANRGPRLDPGKGGSKWMKTGLVVDEGTDLFSCAASIAVSFPPVAYSCGLCLVPDPTSPLTCLGCLLGASFAIIGALISCSSDLSNEVRYIERSWLEDWIVDNPIRKKKTDKDIQFYHADYGEERMLVGRDMLECQIPTKRDNPSYNC